MFRREELTAELIARLVMCTLHELVGDQPVILFGHSTGGFASLATAAQYPHGLAGVESNQQDIVLSSTVVAASAHAAALQAEDVVG